MTTLPQSLLSVLLCAALSACGPKPTQPLETIPAQTLTAKPARFSVTRVGVFEDELAYSGGRGIYVITDTKTGQEFVGVSGIGISELGSHQSGKSRFTDER